MNFIGPVLYNQSFRRPREMNFLDMKCLLWLQNISTD